MLATIKLFFRFFVVTIICAFVSFKVVFTVIAQIDDPEFWVFKVVLFFDKGGFLYYQALLFGLMMSLTVTIYHVVKFRSLGVKKITHEDIRLTQRRSVVSKVGLTTLIKGLSQDKVLSKMKTHQTPHSLTMRSGKSRGSWGEIVTIDVKPAPEEGTYQYKIISEYKFVINQISNLKNMENVVRIERLLAHIQEQSTTRTN